MQPVDGLLPVGYRLDNEGALLEQFGRDLPVDRVVFDNENPGALDGAEVGDGCSGPVSQPTPVRQHGGAEEAGDGVEEERGVDGLGEHLIDVLVALEFVAREPRRRGDEDELRGNGELELVADAGSCRDAIETRHAVVHEDQPEGIFGGLHQTLKRSLGAGDRLYAELEELEVSAENFACVGVVVDNQHAGPDQLARCRPLRLGELLCDTEGDLEEEGAALCGFALGPDATLHELHKLPADGEAETGAAELAGGGVVGLREGLKEATHLLFRDADAGVADREAQQRPAV